jgi:hypothetical protein
MPLWIAERIDDNARNAAIRTRRAGELYGTLQQLLARESIEFIVLKGLTHASLVPDPPPRVQYDVDLYIPRADVYRARDVLVAAGWRPIEGMEAFPTDPELPLAIELHFQFWNPAIERLPAPGVEQFWDRRITRSIAGVDLGVLSPPDALAYAALHLLKHLLRGSVQPFHVYEIARLLDSLSADDAFWQHWTALHSPEMRRLEAVVFRLAQAWFGCLVPPAVEAEVQRLPAATEDWFGRYALSPAVSTFHPNKDEPIACESRVAACSLAIYRRASDATPSSGSIITPVRCPAPWSPA